MRKISNKLSFLVFFLAFGVTFSYAQVDENDETNQWDEVSDSLDWGAEIILAETVIVARGIIDLEEDRRTPVAVSTILRQDIQDKGVGNVEFPEIMKHIPSVYVSNQAGGFGDSQMFLRGFDQTNTAFLLNGQPINGMEDGKMYWSNWSAMTDVANAVQVQRGLGSSKLAISSVGGTVNIVTKATEKTKGGMARLVMGNDSYMKGTVAYDTGLQNKWGFSIMIDYWQSHRKFARGTAGEGQSYFMSVGYKPNNHHNFNFMVFGAPQWHDQNFSKPMKTVRWGNGSVREFGYDEIGIKGNPNYGFYRGKALNARKNYYHKPVANMNWDWEINSQASLSTVLYASLGRGGGTGPLGNGPDFLNSDMPGAYLPNGDIDWDFIADNYNTTIENGIGGGFNGTAIRSSVNNHFWYGAVTNFNYDLPENWSFNVGADVRFYKGDHFRQLVNLLGLKGWKDSNAFRDESQSIITSTFKANPWSSLFSFAKEGERIAYDYTEWVNYQGAFGQIEYANDWMSAFAQGAVSNQSYQREDRWNNPRTVDGVTYPLKSSTVNKTGYNVKGGLAFNLNAENTIFGNAGFYSRQPFLDDVFQGSDPSGHADNTYLREPEVDNEEITGFEVGYRYKTKGLTINVNLYHTKWANRFIALSGRNYPVGDVIYPNVEFLLTDVTQLHKGVEVDFNTRVHRKWTVRGFASYGKWEYSGSTPYDVRDFESFTIIPGESGEADLDGIMIGNAPQFSFGMGTKFEILRGWSADLDLNYYANLWGQMDIRTIDDIVQSESLMPYATVDAGMTYEFRFSGQKFRVRGNVYNLFNDKYINIKDAYGYFYGLGRTFNLGVQYNF